MIWEMELFKGRVKVGMVRLNSAPRIEQRVEPEPGKTYRIIDQRWESWAISKKAGDPDFIGAALVKEVQ